MSYLSHELGDPGQLTLHKHKFPQIYDGDNTTEIWLQLNVQMYLKP